MSTAEFGFLKAELLVEVVLAVVTSADVRQAVSKVLLDNVASEAIPREFTSGINDSLRPQRRDRAKLGEFELGQDVDGSQRARPVVVDDGFRGRVAGGRLL